MQTTRFRFPSPIGPLDVAVGPDGLRALEFVPERSRGPSAGPGRGGAAEEVAGRLRAYFSGDLRALDGIAAIFEGTPFQRQVWEALRTIPAGRTLSYRGLAAAIGRPAAVRAVGLANGMNPIAIVVPCHRVIGSDGRLTGYGGGLWRKEWLLRHEGARFTAPRPPAPRQTSLPLRPGR